MNTSRKAFGRTSRARIFSAAMLSTPAIAAAMLLGGQARAAALYWDINGSSGGATNGTTADGAWDASTPNWSTDAGGSSATSAWVGGNIATFSAGSNATGTSNVTVSGTQNLQGIALEDGTLNLTGGTLDFGSATGTISLSSNSSSTVIAPPRNLTINSVLAGTNGLTIEGGAGTLTLNAANTYSGTTVIGQYSGSGYEYGHSSTTTSKGINPLTVIVTNNNALGIAGDVEFAPETEYDTGTTDSNGAEIFLPKNGVTANASLQLADGLAISGKQAVITGGGQTDVGQLSTLPNATATWNGNVMASGITNNAPNSGTPAIGAQENGTLIVNGQLVNRPGDTNGSNGSWIAKTGRGTVVLTQPSPNFVGGVRVVDGALELQADGALGAAGTDDGFQNVYLNSIGLPNGELGSPQLVFKAPANSSGFDYAYGDAPGTGTYRYIYMNASYNGFTVSGLPTIENKGGNNRFGGAFDISGNFSNSYVHNSFGVDAGSSLELSGRLYGTGTSPRYINKVGGGELIISANNDGTDGNQAGGIAQYGLGGLWEIQDGTLTLRSSDPTGGVLSGANSVTAVINFKIDPGGTLKLDNTLAVNTARIDSTSTINLNGGEFALVGNASQSVSQSAGNVQASGFSTVTVDQPTSFNGSTTTLDFSTATFLNGGTVLLRGIDGSSGFVNINGTLVGGGGAAGSTSISILPQAVGDASASGTGTDFVTIQNGSARALTASEYTPLVSGANSLDNTSATAGGTLSLSADTKVNAVKVAGGTNISIAAGKTLSLNSGALLEAGAGNTNISGGTLAFQTAGGGAVPGYVTVPQGSTMTISSNLGNSSGMTKSGYGLLTLAADNSATYSGPTTINSGVLAISNDNNLGNSSARVNINGGTLRITSSLTSSRTIGLQSPLANFIDVPAGQNVTLAGTINNGGASSGELVKTGEGNLILSGNNTYIGPSGDGTRIDAGTLTITSDSNVHGDSVDPGNTFLNNQLVLNGGSLHLTTSGSYRTPISISSNTGGFLIDPGVHATFGDPLDFASSGRFGGFGTLILDGGGTLNPAANNLYTGDNIIKGGSTLEYTYAQGVSSLSAFHPAHFLLDNGTLLTVGQPTADPNNPLPTDGITTYSANRGITLGAGGGTLAAQVGSSPAPYLLTFPQPIAGGAGSGALTLQTDSQSLINLSGANTYTGGTIIPSGSTVQITGTGTLGTGLVTNNGTLQAQTTFSAPGGITGSGSTTIGDGTNPAVVSAGFYRLPSLTVSAGATAQVLPSGGANFSTSKIGTLNLTPTSLVDITDNKLVLSQPAGTWNGTNAYTGVAGLVQSGRNGGAWNGATGITSSIAAANPNPKLYSIGVVKAGDIKNVADSATTTFGGQTVLGSDTLVMATYGGDANLDGKINIDDYGLIDSHVGQSGTAFGWHNGDFNYDGKINIDDYGIIDGNIGAQGAPIPTVGLSLAVAQVNGVSAVPEPGSLFVLGLAGVGLLGRRRRRRVN